MAKKKDNWLRTVGSGISIQGILLNPATLVLAISLVTIAGTIYLWDEHKVAILDLEDYVLTPDKITINEAQDVPGQQVLAQNLKQLAAGGQDETQSASLLDHDLIDRTLSRFKQVGWIESVRSVKKSKAGLNIDLQYRVPIGMVELNRSNVQRWPVNQAEDRIPIDRSGVILPRELAQAMPLLRLTVFEPVLPSESEAWSAIRDERVLGCAEIGLLLADRWSRLGFYRITTQRSPALPLEATIPFQIWTDTKPIATKIIWGNPPGKELAGEAKAARKLELLDQIYAQMGPLNELPSTTIDIRSGEIVTSRQKTAKQSHSNGSLIK